MRVRGDTTDSLMWGFQSSFRRGVKTALEKSLEVLGVTVEATVFLVGLPSESGSGHRVCVEPQDGPIGAGDLDGLQESAAGFSNDALDGKLVVTTRWIHE